MKLAGTDESAIKLFLHHAFRSHCRKLDDLPTTTEHASRKAQSNLHAHKRYNMPSTRIPYQMVANPIPNGCEARGESGRGVNYPH